MDAKSFIDKARAASEAATADRVKTLAQIAEQGSELVAVERTLNRSIDADEIERLSGRRYALRAALSRARKRAADIEERHRAPAATLKNLESEAARLRERLGASEAKPAWVQTGTEQLKKLEIETAAKLAEMTGRPQSKVSGFVTSYLQLEGHDPRKAAINEFFSEWLSLDRRGASVHPTPFDSIRHVLSELQADRARSRQRLKDHERGIEIKLARLIYLTGPVDLEALRREHRELTLIALLDADAERERQRGFLAALAEADQEILEATQHRDKVQREMREHAEKVTAYQQELERIRREYSGQIAA